MLVTSAVASQLPCGYEGAIVVPPDDRAALRDGLIVARRHLSDLRLAAAEQGPAAVRSMPSFTDYTADLIDICRR